MITDFTLTPNDLQTGCPFFALEGEPELFLMCSREVLGQMAPGEHFVLEAITVHKDGTATVAYRKGDVGSEFLSGESHSVTFPAFASGEDAKSYLEGKRKERERQQQIIRDLCDAFPASGKARRKKR